jgi:hypothetical protein
LPDASNVRIRLFSVNGGRKVLLTNGRFAAGAHTVEMPRNSSGLYLLDFEAGNYRRTLKLAP